MPCDSDDDQTTNHSSTPRVGPLRQRGQGQSGSDGQNDKPDSGGLDDIPGVFIAQQIDDIEADSGEDEQERSAAPRTKYPETAENQKSAETRQVPLHLGENHARTGKIAPNKSSPQESASRRKRPGGEKATDQPRDHQ